MSDDPTISASGIADASVVDALGSCVPGPTEGQGHSGTCCTGTFAKPAEGWDPAYWEVRQIHSGPENRLPPDELPDGMIEIGFPLRYEYRLTPEGRFAMLARSAWTHLQHGHDIIGRHPQFDKRNRTAWKERDYGLRGPRL